MRIKLLKRGKGIGKGNKTICMKKLYSYYNNFSNKKEPKNIWHFRFSFYIFKNNFLKSSVMRGTKQSELFTKLQKVDYNEL